MSIFQKFLDSNLEGEVFGSPMSAKVDSGKSPGSDGLDHIKVFQSKVRAPFSAAGTGKDNVIVFDVVSGHYLDDVFRGITFRDAALSTSRET